MHFTFKTCQIVADTSMITQFHEFFECNFWRFFCNLSRMYEGGSGLGQLVSYYRCLCLFPRQAKYFMSKQAESNRRYYGFRARYDDIYSRVLPRFFDQVRHKTMYASSGNKHFFTKSCHRKTYQNYEQSRQKLGTFLENKVL